ncbi:hypothetical protein BD779DRAFT_1628584 [Infundibulicybe gibba]|nr:hypothetical protein BD779DRAFT_1628584 [Infundibulicybe gibba]
MAGLIGWYPFSQHVGREWIIFYDIPSTMPGNAWSSNTWKTRFSLNYKGLAYKTEWVEYPDIEPLCKKLGAAPTYTKETGEPLYTLPVIFDPHTRRIISDSFAIAKYLDEQYPETPKLIPAGTHALQRAFIAAFYQAVDVLWEFTIPQTCVRLRSGSEPFFRSTREKDFGMKLEAVVPTGSARTEKLAQLEAGFGKYLAWVAYNPSGGVFVTGDTPVFVDFMVASFLIWLKVLWEDGEDGEIWGQVKEWHGGKLRKLLAAVDKYAAVDK